MAGDSEIGSFDERQLQRERLLDLEERIRPYRAAAFGVLFAALIATGPWFGWWFLIPCAVAIGAFTVGEKCRERSARPENWLVASWAISPLMIAVSIALSGGIDSPARSWMVLPLVTLSSRFGVRGTVYGTAYSMALLGLAVVVPDPAAFAANPIPMVHVVAMCLAVTLLGRAIVQSDRDHRREAILDPLTGLFNRSALAQRFADERIAASTDRVALIVGDLDHFKGVNDQYGHATGDAVLKDVAYLMRKHLRALDQVYRVGGEEFVAVLPGSDLRNAEEAAERLRVAIGAAQPAGLDVSISFGVVAGEGAECRDFDSLYRLADAALYQAKRGGRNAVRAASTEAPEPAPVLSVVPA